MSRIFQLRIPLDDYVEENYVGFHGLKNTGICTGNWNSTGDKLVGEIMAERLCQGFFN